MSGAKGRAASEFRPKLHSRSESLSLEGLEKSRAVGRKSLDITKFGHESLGMGRKSLDSDFRDRILVCPDIHGPRRNSCPGNPDSNSRRNYANWV